MSSRKRCPQDPSFVGVSLGQQVKPTPNLKQLKQLKIIKAQGLNLKAIKLTY